MKAKMDKLMKGSLIASIIIVLVLITVATFYKLIISSDYIVFKVANVNTLYEKVKKAEKDTGSMEIGEEDINAVLQGYAKKFSEYKNIKILGLYSQLDKTNLSLFIPVEYGWLNTILYCSGEIRFENDKIIYNPSVFKLGKIKLSKDLVLSKLKGFNNEDITFENNEIYISKIMLPFDVVALSLRDSKITAQIQKLAINEAANSNTPPSSTNKTVNTTPQKTSAATKQDILKRASRQLSGVRNDIKSSEGKLIISKIQTVVNKMISDPNYAYQAEANAVKAEYSSLPSSDRDNIKEAILNNMDTSTMRQIRSTFGL